MAEFTGFPTQALEFYRGLESDNTPAYWVAHRAVYDAAVREPMQALCERLRPEFGEAKIFHPHRDVRFGRDRTPYKTHQGAVLGDIDGPGWRYVQISGAGLLVAAGTWYLDQAQLVHYREAVNDPATGASLVEAVAAVRAAGHEIGGELLERPPAEVGGDAPRTELLRHLSLTASHDFDAPDWVHTAQAADVVAQTWREMTPLTDWLTANVGRSERPHG